MQTKTKVSDVTTIKPFELRLPPEFDMKPDFEVDLPSDAKALIYKCRDYIRVWDGKGDSTVMHDGYRIRVMQRGRNMASNEFLKTEYDVYSRILHFVELLTPKKRKVVSEEETYA